MTIITVEKRFCDYNKAYTPPETCDTISFSNNWGSFLCKIEATILFEKEVSYDTQMFFNSIFLQNRLVEGVRRTGRMRKVHYVMLV